MVHPKTVDHRENLTTPEKRALAACLMARGHRRACAAIGLARMTVYRALRGEPVCRATLTQVRMALSLLTERQP